MIVCEICQQHVDETDRRALTQHYWTHRIGGPGIIIRHFHGGVAPVCACGCGELTQYNKVKCAFGEYLAGHQSWKRRVVEGTATEDRLPAPFKSGGREAEHPLTPTIYCLTNQVNGKQYVGLDSYWPGRRNYHLSLLRRGKHYNPKLQRAFDKYCEEAFQFRVLEQLATVEELGPREQHWIRVLGTYPDGYNLTLGGEGTESHLTRNERRKALALLKPKVEKVDGRKLAPAEERVVKQTQSESCDAEGNPHCVECGLSFTDRKELIQHFWFKHRVNAQVTVLHFYHGGVPPLCECGCGEKTRYSPHNSTYNPFTNGHNVKGTQRSDEMRKKLSDARKKMKIEGFYEQFTGENNSNAKAARLKKGR